MRLLIAAPTMGDAMEEHRAGLRATAVSNYVIYFSSNARGIEVYRMLHAARRREGYM